MNKIEFLATELPYKLKVTEGNPNDEYTYFGCWFETDIINDRIDKIIPIIRHIDDLTKECIQGDYNDGNPFIPIVELAKFENLLEPISFDTMEDLSRGVRGCCAKDRFNHQWFMYSYRSGFSIWHKPHGESDHSPTLLENQLQLFQQLLKWHFWPNMPEGEKVIYVTNQYNPYK